MYNNSCENTYQYLESLQIPYRKLKDSTNNGISGMKTCEALGFPPGEVYKTVMVLSNKKNHPYIAVLPANRKLDFDKFGVAVGTHCHKAGCAFIRSICSEKNGLFGPFFPKNIQVCLDSSAQKHRNIIVNAGGAGNYIELAVSDFVSAVRCRFGELSSEDSVELYGKNYALPIGALIDNFRITAVKIITALEIFYEATDCTSGKAVHICEFFPRFHGCYASRGINGESVKWLKYTNDMQPRFTPDSSGMIKSRYHFPPAHNFAVNCPRVIDQFEQNDTFYTVYEPPCGKPIREILSDTNVWKWEKIKSALMPLLKQIQSERTPVGCIRPDTVYVDFENNRAMLLPFCAETDIFGQYSGMRFLYHADYNPFMVKDETAFYRVLCYAVAGKQWYSHYLDDISEIIRKALSKEGAIQILSGAKLK